MNIRLLVLDIDGTIAGESNTVSDTVREAIAAAQSQGIQVALATGRMYHSALRFYELIGSKLPIIAYNGAWIQSPLTGIRHHHFPVSEAIALELLDYFEQSQWSEKIEVHCYIDDQLYVSEVTARTEAYRKRAKMEPILVDDLRNILNLPTTKVLGISHPKLIKKILKELQERYSREQLYLTQSTPIYFEATHPQASKGVGIRFLAEEFLNLEASQVMAIGDNFNDLEMLEYAGLSVAMGNAPDAVKKVANWVAPDVEKDGVAIAINQFLLS